MSFASDDGEGVYSSANLAQTYSALLCLAILGDDLKRVDKEALLKTLQKSQKEDGSFWSEGRDSESDMRFVFCAVAICHILRDFSYIDFSSMRNFIRNSLNYDGGIGQGPGDESHGGSTFCAIASLSLANCLWDGSVLSRREIDKLVKWALWKQDEGFHGRAHKPDDSCYAFWIGATLEILNANHLMDKEKLRSFLLIAQHQYMGGFCKIPEASGFPVPPPVGRLELLTKAIDLHISQFFKAKKCAARTVDINVVETSAIGGGRAQERDPLDYVPELGPIEDLDLPDILPDLPGIAEDLTLLDYDIPPPVFPDMPGIPEELHAKPGEWSRQRNLMQTALRKASFLRSRFK
ncbi:prenyltransferase and squalene oxidase repeat-containing domain protein [Ostertagia ostertagi]